MTMVAHASATPLVAKVPGQPHLSIHSTAQVHPFSQMVGNVFVGAEVLIAPGCSIRADEGTPFYLGDGSTVEEGTIIHGLPQGNVLGDDQRPYSVWIGQRVTLTHMTLVHGPAYVGDDCFIGFRSTVFNARVGRGCIVMMHALIQDVEIPPGKFVPSGSIITTQQQADRLPDVQSVDVNFSTQIVGISDALRTGTVAASPGISAAAPPTPSGSVPSPESSSRSSYKPDMPNTHLTPDVVDQVRHLLAQGYQIGTEHADKRRFQTSSWYSCTPIQANRESDVLSALEACLVEHGGEYVRMFGIDAKNRRRFGELVIQRPNGNSSNGYVQRNTASTAAPSYSQPSSNYAAPAASYRGGLDPAAVEQVRGWLSQGHQVGMEHADKRHFQTSSWYSCTPIRSNRESDVMAGLEACLAEHGGEYVRIFGIDAANKRRVGEVIVQRPGQSSNGQPSAAPSYSYSSSPTPAPSYSSAPSGGSATVSPEVVEQIRGWLGQGCRIAAEHADTRRFQTSSWQSCGFLEGNRDGEILSSLEQCMRANGQHYVKVYGVNPQSKRRMGEVIVQRPAR